MADNSTHGSKRIDPGMQGSARQSPYPDVEIYNRPSTPRISSGNLGLSIAVGIVLLLLVGILAIALL